MGKAFQVLRGYDKEVLEKLAELFLVNVTARMTDVGLADSAIIQNLRTEVDVERQTVTLFIPAYFQYIESGRRPGAKPPPIRPILDWMKRYRVAPGNENRVVYAIVKSIAKRGIKPRKFMQAALEETERDGAELLELTFDIEMDDYIAELIK
jgi:hypothetical protein